MTKIDSKSIKRIFLFESYVNFRSMLSFPLLFFSYLVRAFSNSNIKNDKIVKYDYFSSFLLMLLCGVFLLYTLFGNYVEDTNIIKEIHKKGKFLKYLKVKIASLILIVTIYSLLIFYYNIEINKILNFSYSIPITFNFMIFIFLFVFLLIETFIELINKRFCFFHKPKLIKRNKLEKEYFDIYDLSEESKEDKP